jgi:hypothetical protein
VSKIIVAVTNIKHNNLKITAGDPIPIEEFDKDSLLKLYELGVIAKVDAEDVEEDKSLTPEDMHGVGANVKAPEPDAGTPKTPEELAAKSTPVSAPVPVTKPAAAQPKIETK